MLWAALLLSLSAQASNHKTVFSDNFPKADICDQATVSLTNSDGGITSTEKLSLCHDRELSVVLSKNCQDDKCDLVRAAQTKKLALNFRDRGSPASWLCQELGGDPQMVFISNNEKTNKVYACRKGKDFVAADYLIATMGISKPAKTTAVAKASNDVVAAQEIKPARDREPTQAGPDCTPGMRLITDKGYSNIPVNNAIYSADVDKVRQYEAALTKDGGILCPENCFNYANMVGYDPKNPGTFARHQDTVGMCTTMSTADYICHELKRKGKLPNTPENKQGCSAFDLEVQNYLDRLTFDGVVKEMDPYTIESLFGKRNVESQADTAMVDHDNERHLQVAAKRGICPESLFPSEFRGTQTGDLRRIYEIIQERLREKKRSGKTEAQASLIAFCPECEKIAPSLTKEQWAEVGRLLDSTKDLDKSDFRILKKINELACPPEKRIKFSLDDVWVNKRHVEHTRWLLARDGRIALANFPARILSPNLKFDENGKKKTGYIVDGHTALLVSSWAVIAKGKPACYYAFKSSWGPTYCKATLAWFEKKMAANPELLQDPEFKDGPGFSCGDDGTFYLHHDVFNKTFSQDRQNNNFQW